MERGTIFLLIIIILYNNNNTNNNNDNDNIKQYVLCIYNIYKL